MVGAIRMNKSKIAVKRKLSEERRRKLSEAQKKAWANGSYTKERNLNISKALKGKSKPPRTEEHCKKLSISHMGRKQSMETRIKRSKTMIARREDHPNWKGGTTKLNVSIRNSYRYRIWRILVFERDNYTCQICGNRGSQELNADHIKPFAFYPKLRFDIENGRTLCIDCHKKTDTYLNSYGMNQYTKGRGYAQQ